VHPASWEAIVQEFLIAWDYLGVFVGIIATGLGFPMPEELPVVIGGGLVHELNPTDFRWWRMLVACIAGVLVGDSCLYCIGRFWGIRLVQIPFIKKHLMTPARLVSISHNFEKYGVKILLFARLTPGIRAPIFITAGITKLPWVKFLFADGIYAIPGVSLLFILGYWFGDTVAGIVEAGESLGRSIVWLVLLIGIAGYFLYRHLRKPVVEGSPKEMPPVVGQVTSKLDQTLETVTEKILHPHAEAKPSPSEPAPPPPPANVQASPQSVKIEPIKEGAPRGTPIAVAALLGVAGSFVYFLYRQFHRPVLEETPREMPPVSDPAPASANGRVSTGGDNADSSEGESRARPVVVVGIASLLGVVGSLGYFLYRFLRRPAGASSPKEMQPTRSQETADKVLPDPGNTAPASPNGRPALPIDPAAQHPPEGHSH
jgi:membrane protein DedA with SNARE-associated domain